MNNHSLKTKYFSFASFSAINFSNYILTASKSSPLYVTLCANYTVVSFFPAVFFFPLFSLVRFLCVGFFRILPVAFDILNFSPVYGWNPYLTLTAFRALLSYKPAFDK